ncbi:MAG: 2-oxoacid:acceptor oxidoreductase subunit alpha [Candidatus Eisenbacteria bacterium]
MSTHVAEAAGTGSGSRTTVPQHIIEIVSDSGEGAQKAGQAFGAVCAKSGRGVWTVEIIPAEIKPPARSQAGASGIRIRVGSRTVTNMGDEADLVVAFNEQVLYGRITQHAFRKGTNILLENRWATDDSPEIRELYANALQEFRDKGFVVHELPLEQECLKHTSNPRVGKNMFVLGMLCSIYGFEVERALEEAAFLFRKKGEKVVALNHELIRAGYTYATDHLPIAFAVPARPNPGKSIVVNGNQAVGLGIMAAGIDVVAMYPITPATSVSHYLGEAFHRVGGLLHQAEDEIAAIGFAIGASYAGKTACTVTSGPGLALKTEFLGLAVMGEIPLVIVDVQRGGPSTGLPTKVEQGDLLASIWGQPGDSPKVVIAPATIEECFHFVITARKLAEAFRTPVIVLTDANLATGVQPIPRPNPQEEWLAPPIDQAPWDKNVLAYDWDVESGASPRPIPGQPGGEYVLTGLSHTKDAHVAYDPDSNRVGMEMRSRKLAALQKALKPPKVFGDESGGELLLVGWGSTQGAIEEGVERARAEGQSVSSVHLRFMSPLEPGLEEIFRRFKKVVAIGIHYSDPEDSPIDKPNRRRSQLAILLREQTLVDVESWTRVEGQPLSPGTIYEAIQDHLGRLARKES